MISDKQPTPWPVRTGVLPAALATILKHRWLYCSSAGLGFKL